MELQEKFKKLFIGYGSLWVDSLDNEEMLDYFPIEKVAKQSTKLCLEEQIKLFINIRTVLEEDSKEETNLTEWGKGYVQSTLDVIKGIEETIDGLQQQLKSLE